MYIYICIDIVSLVCTSHAVPFRPWRQGELGPTGFPRGPRLRGIQNDGVFQKTRARSPEKSGSFLKCGIPKTMDVIS